MEGSSLWWRGAIAGGGDWSQVKGAIAGGGEQSQVERSDCRWYGKFAGGGN